MHARHQHNPLLHTPSGDVDPHESEAIPCYLLAEHSAAPLKLSAETVRVAWEFWGSYGFLPTSQKEFCCFTLTGGVQTRFLLLFRIQRNIFTPCRLDKTLRKRWEAEGNVLMWGQARRKWSLLGCHLSSINWISIQLVSFVGFLFLVLSCSKSYHSTVYCEFSLNTRDLLTSARCFLNDGSLASHQRSSAHRTPY